jgi:hypothetical protein
VVARAKEVGGMTPTHSNLANSEPIPFKASKAKRYVEFTLHHPAPKPGSGLPMMSDLNVLPKGWTLAAFNIVEPEAPPKHGEDLIRTLDALIAEAQKLRDEAMTYTELDSETLWLTFIEDLAEDVMDALNALPDPTDEP